MVEHFIAIFDALSESDALRTLPALYLIVRPEMGAAQQNYFDMFFGTRSPQNPPQAPLVASIPNPDLFPLQ